MPNKLQHSPHLEIEKYAQSHEKNNKIIIDFEELKKYPDLEELIFKKPTETIQALQHSSRKKIVFSNNLTPMNNPLTSSNIGSLISTMAHVITVSPVNPRMAVAVFECRSCMRIHEIEQKTNIIYEPAVCMECGGRSFKLIQDESTYIDSQTATVRVNTINSEGKTISKKITLILEGELTDIIQDYTQVKIIGILKASRDEYTKHFDKYIYVEALEPVKDSSIFYVEPPDFDEVNTRKSPEYNSWRKEILRKYNGKCAICDDDFRVDVHHILGYKKYPEFRTAEWNGIVLCNACHHKLHSRHGVTSSDIFDLVRFAVEETSIRKDREIARLFNLLNKG